MTMGYNDRQVAQNFAQSATGRSSSDRNNNGIPDREEISIKVSRPASKRPAAGNQMPVQRPVQSAPNPRSNPTSVSAYFPEGLDVNNFRQFMNTPAGKEHMRQVIEKVRTSMTPQGQQPRGIFDRLLKQFNVGN